jgi:hypothetical protein
VRRIAEIGFLGFVQTIAAVCIRGCKVCIPAAYKLLFYRSGFLLLAGIEYSGERNAAENYSGYAHTSNYVE